MNKVTSIIASLIVAAGFVHADSDGQVFYTHDAAPAIRVNNTGSEVVSIVVTGGGTNVAVTIGATLNNINGDGDTDTVAELGAAIAACTNSAGKKVLSVDTACAVATTESTDGELLDATTTIYGGQWGHIKWDTSDVKHYRAYVPKASKGAGRGGKYIDSVYGNVGGTGDVTIKGYIDGTEVFESYVVSPTYVKALDNNTNTVNNIVVIDIPVGVYVGQDQAFVLSADRATTGTTGGVGIRNKNK